MKNLILISIFCFISVGIFAQQFKGGLLLGACGSQVDGDGWGGYDKYGLIAGGTVQYDFSEKWNLRTEIKYFQKGSKRRADRDMGGYVIYKMKLHCIEMPFILSRQFKININKYEAEIGAEAGLGLSYLVKGSEENMSYEIVNGNEFEKFALDFIYGINYKFNDHFRLHYNVHYSILAIRKGPEYSNPFDNYLFRKNQYNNIMSLTLFYIF